ncbi:MAG: hypothetical protein ACLPUG_06210 [Acidimicrobiales bacterium]
MGGAVVVETGIVVGGTKIVVVVVVVVVVVCVVELPGVAERAVELVHAATVNARTIIAVTLILRTVVIISPSALGSRRAPQSSAPNQLDLVLLALIAMFVIACWRSSPSGSAW